MQSQVPAAVARLLVAGAGLATVSFGCSNETTRPSPAPLPEAGWIAPSPNDTLRGLAELAPWVDLGVPVRQVSFFANGEEIGSRTETPWTLKWRPLDVSTGPELRPLELVAEARGAGASVRTPLLRVWYRRDDPPEVTWSPPGRTDWIELVPERYLSAQAWDREDGLLPASSIEWRTGSGRRQVGPLLPARILDPGENAITLRAHDSAGNEGERSFWVYGFAYEGQAQALHAGRDLQRALSALDFEALGRLLDPRFEIRTCEEPPGAASPDPLSRQELLSMLGTAAGRPGLRSFRWAGTLEPQGEDARGWAVLRWRSMGILLATAEAEWRTIGLSAELVLAQAPDGWKVRAWRELDRGDGPGAAGFLRAHAHGP